MDNRTQLLQKLNATVARYNLTLTPLFRMGYTNDLLNNIKAEENALVAIEVLTLFLVALCCVLTALHYFRGPYATSVLRRTVARGKRRRLTTSEV